MDAGHHFFCRRFLAARKRPFEKLEFDQVGTFIGVVYLGGVFVFCIAEQYLILAG
jgi:hypothetical protein